MKKSLFIKLLKNLNRKKKKKYITGTLIENFKNYPLNNAKSFSIHKSSSENVEMFLAQNFFTNEEFKDSLSIEINKDGKTSIEFEIFLIKFILLNNIK